LVKGAPWARGKADVRKQKRTRLVAGPLSLLETGVIAFMGDGEKKRPGVSLSGATTSLD